MMEEGKFSGRDYDGTRNMKSRRWIKENIARKLKICDNDDCI